ALAQGLQRALRQAPDAMEAQARHWVQQLVLVAQACLLRRHAPAAVADAFIATRCGPCASGGVLGASPVQGLDSASILQRALPY
ncbi:DNA alkylation response protein, partial [Comamonas aquatica]|nr:DNA alkylation response protein [Comamonas aquatica]